MLWTKNGEKIHPLQKTLQGKGRRGVLGARPHCEDGCKCKALGCWGTRECSATDHNRVDFSRTISSLCTAILHGQGAATRRWAPELLTGLPPQPLDLCKQAYRLSK